jgi:uncharacterized membrane protein (DUF2068 family)
MAERDTSGAGLRLIVAYKVAKAAGEFALAAILAVVGAEVPAGDVAATLSRHVAAAWSLEVCRVVTSAATPHTIELMMAALLLDGALTLGEGWALHRRFPWASWLVVITTGSLLPFEVIELVRRPRAVRLPTHRSATSSWPASSRRSATRPRSQALHADSPTAATAP